MDFGLEHFHASGRIFKDSDDRGMQFFLKVGEDSTFGPGIGIFTEWEGNGRKLHSAIFGSVGNSLKVDFSEIQTSRSWAVHVEYVPAPDFRKSISKAF